PQGANASTIRSTLACGYMPPVSGGAGVCLGTFIEPGPAGGDGNIRDIQTANPAAGAEIAVSTVPTGAIWRLLTFNTILIQGITQTPLPSLRFRNAGGAFL